MQTELSVFRIKKMESHMFVEDAILVPIQEDWSYNLLWVIGA
jgi:hypothetical protein